MQCKCPPLTAFRSLCMATTLAYVMPALMSFASGILLADPRLRAASYTSVALPSAVAAASVTMVCWLFERLIDDAYEVSTGLAAAIGFVCSAMVAGLLVGGAFAAGGLQFEVLHYAVPSAAIGGAIAAATWARSLRRKTKLIADEKRLLLKVAT